jgi:hypothetical protein
MPITTETFTRTEYRCEVCGRRHVDHGNHPLPSGWKRLAAGKPLVFCPEHVRAAAATAFETVMVWMGDDDE